MGDVHVVRAPVGHMPPEYSYHQRKRIVDPLRAIVDLGAWPSQKSQFSPSGTGCAGERPAFLGRQRQLHGDFLDLAQLAAADRGHGAAEQRELVAPLLRADLHHLAGLLDRGHELLAFVDRQRQRLFAIDVLAGLERRQRDLGVPMVGRADRDRFDVLAIEQLAIVLVDVRLGEVLLPWPARRAAAARRRRRRCRHSTGAARIAASPARPSRWRRSRAFVLRLVGAGAAGEPIRIAPPTPASRPTFARTGDA